MIVIGVDVHKQSVTAVAVDEAGRMLDERTVLVGSDELIGWAAGLSAERLWALEDCRQLTPWLERQLLGRGEELVRVSPKLTVPERRAGRERGKSDPIDALAVARAALREPDLPRPLPGEQVYREIKLLVDHREPGEVYKYYAMYQAILFDLRLRSGCPAPADRFYANFPNCREVVFNLDTGQVEDRAATDTGIGLVFVTDYYVQLPSARYP